MLSGAQSFKACTSVFHFSLNKLEIVPEPKRNRCAHLHQALRKITGSADDCMCVAAQLPWVLLPDLAQREAAWAKHSEALLGGRTTLHLTGGAEVTVTHRPLALEARVGGKPALKFNAEGLLQYEHRRLTRVSASARRRPYLSTSCRGNGCILAWQVDACTLLARRTTGVFSNVAFSYSCGTASTSRGVAKSLTTFMPPYRRRVTAMVCSRRPSARTQTRSRRDRRA